LDRRDQFFICANPSSAASLFSFAASAWGKALTLLESGPGILTAAFWRRDQNMRRILTGAHSIRAQLESSFIRPGK
jgi:hypothetical protein